MSKEFESEHDRIISLESKFSDLDDRLEELENTITGGDENFSPIGTMKGFPVFQMMPVWFSPLAALTPNIPRDPKSIYHEIKTEKRCDGNAASSPLYTINIAGNYKFKLENRGETPSGLCEASLRISRPGAGNPVFTSPTVKKNNIVEFNHPIQAGDTVHIVCSGATSKKVYEVQILAP